ncbi:MAG: hypothetical protein ACE5H1_01960 [Thermodesulfobacteriota bacterium]
MKASPNRKDYRFIGTRLYRDEERKNIPKDWSLGTFEKKGKWSLLNKCKKKDTNG